MTTVTKKKQEILGKLSELGIPDVLIPKQGLSCENNSATNNFERTQDLQILPQGWNGGSKPLFASLFKEHKPELVVEVGAWKGLGTITMASALASESPSGAVLSVDTWLGSYEHMKDFTGLLTRNKEGASTLFDEWRTNVLDHECSGNVVGLQLDSTSAAHLCKEQEITPDLVYLDGSNVVHQVYADLRAWWEVLAPGGMLAGDDLDWPSVQTALQVFCSEVGTMFAQNGTYWFISKQR